MENGKADFSLLEVQARWAYSELNSGIASSYYKGGDMDRLRDMRSRGLPFEALTAADYYPLAFACGCARPNLFVYLIGCERFQLRTITRSELGEIIVPPNVWSDSAGAWVKLSEYAAGDSLDLRDARFRESADTVYRPNSEPFTVGRSFQYPILIDGYHRAVHFWRYAPDGASTPVFLPFMK
jgi:hypothetical protein